MAQNMVTPLAASLLHFQLKRCLKTWFEFWDYLAWQLIWLLFKKYWAIFFPNHLVTLAMTKEQFTLMT